MTGPHDRGRRYARRIRRELGDTVTSHQTLGRTLGGPAGRDGVLSEKQVFSSVTSEGVIRQHELYVARHCGCGRLLLESNLAIATCATCDRVTCATCNRMCVRCGRTICVEHATKHAAADDELVFLCPRHACFTFLWKWIGGHP